MRLPSLVLASAGLLGITLVACSRPPDGLQDLPAVQAFQLSSSNDTPFTEADLNGEVWVVNFFFTRCPTICPLLMDGINEVYQRWADDDRVHFLSITVDGGFDTPEVLRAYREARGLPSDRWVLANSSVINDVLDIIAPVVLHPDRYLDWRGNCESLWKRSLELKGLMPSVRRFERPMFTAAVEGDPTRWSVATPSIVDEGVLLKYPEEYGETKLTCSRLVAESK